MKAIMFPESNVVFAKDQPQYKQLPAFRSSDEHGEVISCYHLNIKERVHLLLFGRLWLHQLTFGHSLYIRGSLLFSLTFPKEKIKLQIQNKPAQGRTEEKPFNFFEEMQKK